MSRYEYRLLRVIYYDKHGGNDVGRRRGRDRDRYYYVRGTDLPEPILFADEDGDDGFTFTARADAEFINYLNTLGMEGWRLLSYTPIISPVNERPWPNGSFLPMRAIE